MDNKEIVQIASGMAGLAGAAYKIWKTYYSKTGTTYESFDKDLARITVLCKKANAESFHRIVLFVAHKKKGKYAVVDAITEWVSHIDDSIINTYEAFIPDEQYLDMLRGLEVGESYNYVVESMPDGTISKIYHISGIGISIISTVHKSKNKLYYISAASLETEYQERHHIINKVIVGQMTRLLERYF